jgi:MFS family permease
MWQEIEAFFNRALKYSLTRKKFFLLFPALVLCGVLIVLCHTFWLGANPWVRASLAFVPGFLCGGILMTIGVPLIRLYHDEIKEKKLSVNKTLGQSVGLMGGIASLIIPILTAYLVLWFVLGIFYLLKHMSGVGEYLGIFLSFGPFLLILGSFFLTIVNLFLLFFMPPVVALKSTMRWELAEDVLLKICKQPFIHLMLLGLGLIPLLIVLGFMIFAATLTGMSIFVLERTWEISLQWSCIMIPFAALLTPVVIFFFNFAAECFVMLQKRAKK